MMGKLAAGFIVVVALAAGIGVYWMQEYAFYHDAAFQPGAEVVLTPLSGGTPEAIPVTGLSGIDADSSPIRFRACFTTPLTQATLTETYKVYEKPTPLNAPNWFSCFNARKIGAALERGEAIAFLSVPNIAPGVDRVVAVFPDGRAYAWQQLNNPDAE
ncbi:MAG: histidine kinase [Rhodobacteraceae bacterium]|nr:histidine kinase [Paracoccaceae bacterium]